MLYNFYNKEFSNLQTILFHLKSSLVFSKETKKFFWKIKKSLFNLLKNNFFNTKIKYQLNIFFSDNLYLRIRIKRKRRRSNL